MSNSDHVASSATPPDRKRPRLRAAEPSRPQVIGPSTLVLADGHPLVLEGLVSVFRTEPRFQVVARCAESKDVLRAVRLHRPHILILDPRLPGADGLSVVETIRQEKLPTRVVLLAASLTEDQVVNALRLGVRGIVLKEMGIPSIVQCVRAVAAGERWMDRQAFSRAMDRLLEREIGLRELSGILTRRELEIVRLLAQGQSNREMARALGIDEGTVKSHLHSVYEKLNLDNRVELALYVRERGLA